MRLPEPRPAPAQFKARSYEPIQPKIDILPRPEPRPAPKLGDTSRFDKTLANAVLPDTTPRKAIIEIRPQVLKPATARGAAAIEKPAPKPAPQTCPAGSANAGSAASARRAARSGEAGNRRRPDVKPQPAPREWRDGGSRSRCGAAAAKAAAPAPLTPAPAVPAPAQRPTPAPPMQTAVPVTAPRPPSR